MEDIDNKILLALKKQPTTCNGLREKLNLPRPESLLDKRLQMLRKRNLIEYKIITTNNRGRHPLEFFLSKKALDLLEKE